MIQPFCEHLSSFDGNFMLRDPEAFSSSPNKKCSYGYKCCESHLWTFIKENQLDQIYAFIWRINDSVFDPRYMNFNLDHSAEEQTNKGILLKVTHMSLIGIPTSYSFSTPFGKIDFPLTAIPLHKSRRQFCDFIRKYPVEAHKEENFSKTFSLNYSEDAHPVECHLDNQKRCVEILAKIWNMLENERLKTRALQPLSINTISAKSVSKFELGKEVPYVTYSYYEAMKLDENKNPKLFTNRSVRKYFLSLEDFQNEKLKTNSLYALDQAKPYTIKLHYCNITLLDGRRASFILNVLEIGILFKEMLPKVLIASDYEGSSGIAFEGKVVNRKAEEILSALFENVQQFKGWCGT